MNTPLVEVNLPVHFSREAKVWINILLEAGQQGLLISDGVALIIAEQLGLSSHEIHALDSFLSAEIHRVLARVVRQQSDALS